jgi:hypothetical protein
MRPLAQELSPMVAEVEVEVDKARYVQGKH